MAERIDKPEEENEEDRDVDSETVRKNGRKVAWVDWDSGGPGAGAGRVTAYEFEGKFYVTHDAGMDCYDTFEQAVQGGGIRLGGASRKLWVAESYQKAHRAVVKNR